MTGVVEQVASYHSTTLEFAPDGDQSRKHMPAYVLDFTHLWP